jgi:nucleotide-binding universal stress UspA family protein
MSAARNTTSTPDETEVLREEIEQTREELAHTAQALGEKLDVKKQARSAATTVQQRVQERVQEVPALAASQWQRDPQSIVVGVATFFVVMVLLEWRHGR